MPDFKVLPTVNGVDLVTQDQILDDAFNVGAKDSARTVILSDFSINNSSWFLSGSIAFLLDAAVGDEILMSITGYWQAQPAYGAIDAVLLNASNGIIRRLSGHTGASDGYGVWAWLGVPSVERPFGGGAKFVIESGDLVNSNTVKIGILFRSTGLKTMSMSGGTTPLIVEATNIGKPGSVVDGGGLPGGGLPVGGDYGQIIVKQSADDGDADWGNLTDLDAFYKLSALEGWGATGATKTPNPNNYAGFFADELNQATTIANPSGSHTNGKRFRLRLRSSVARALTWGDKYESTTRGGTLPASTVVDEFLFLEFEYHYAADKWYLIDGGVPFTQQALQANGMGVLVHDADSDMLRGTDFATYTWIGTVEPTNMAENDIWFNPSL